MSTTVDAQNYVYLRSELLCYVFTFLHKSTAVGLTECINAFYKPAEIAAARDLLWGTYETLFNEINMKKQRRPTLPPDRAAARAYAEDISTWSNALVNECPDDLHTLFFAVDLNNVPPCPPEEVNMFSLVSRVAALEKETKRQASDMVSMQLQIQQQGADTAHYASHSQHWPQLQQQTHVKSMDSSYSGVTARTQEQPSDNRDAAGPSSQNANVQPSQRPVKKANEHRRLVRMAAKDSRQVTGKAADADVNGLVKASSKVKRLFVYRLDKSCDEEALKAYMCKRNAAPKQVRCTSKEDWLTNSFCVTVDEAYFNLVFSDTFWPPEVRCREWITNPRRSAASQEAPSQQAASGEESCESSSSESNSGHN